jgi:hypothetical protein
LNHNVEVHSNSAHERKENMMLHKISILLAVSALVVATGGTALSSRFLHMEPDPAKFGELPPDGTVWHEVHPDFCTHYDQIRYHDNGDDIVSICDMITLTDPTGATYGHHITDVYWTYVFEEGPDFLYFEALTDPHTSPIKQSWHLVYPTEDFCQYWGIIDWLDANNTNMIDACDELVFMRPDGSQVMMHVVEVSIDIVIDEGSAADEGTWGKIKSFFGDMF